MAIKTDAAIDGQAIYREGLKDKFWAIRGYAIQAYSNLENALCELLNIFLGTRIDFTSIIFYKIVAVGTRNSIMDELQSRKYNTKYDLFFSTLMNRVRETADERNHIAHWNAAANVDDDAKFKSMELVRPGFGINDPAAVPITSSKLNAFITRCEFLTLLCLKFRFYVSLQHGDGPVTAWKEEQLKAWHEIFQQQVSYPPASSHPLYQMTQAPESLPLSFVQLTHGDHKPASSSETPKREKQPSKHKQKRKAKKERRDSWKKTRP